MISAAPALPMRSTRRQRAAECPPKRAGRPVPPSARPPASRPGTTSATPACRYPDAAATIYPHRGRRAGGLKSIRMANIVRAGRTVDTIHITAVADGRPIPLGKIQVRTGDVVRTSEPPDITNAIAFGYSGGRMGSTHWIQFLWAEVTYSLSGGFVHAQGSIRMTGSPVRVPLTVRAAAPAWIFDLGGERPFLRERGPQFVKASHERHLGPARSGPALHPSPTRSGAIRPSASDIRFILTRRQHFLIQCDRAVFAIGWIATTAFTRNVVAREQHCPVQYDACLTPRCQRASPVRSGR